MRPQPKLKGSIFRPVLAQLGPLGITAMIVATTAVIAAGYLANVPSVLLGVIVDAIVAGQSVNKVWPIFGLIVACLVGRVTLVIVQKYLVERTAVGVQKHVFLDNVRTVLSLPVEALQHLRAGETTARLEKRTHGTTRFLKLIFLEALPQLAVAIPAVILSFTQSGLAGAVMLVVLVMSAAVTAVQIRSQKGIRIALINKTTGLAGHVSEMLSHLDFVRVSAMSRRVRSRFESEAEVIRNVEFLHHKWMMGFDALKGLIEDGGLAVIVGIGIFQVASGNMTPGTILTLAMLYKSAAIPLQNLHRIVDELHESALQIDAAGQILGRNPDPSLAGGVSPLVGDRGPLVSIRNLSFIRTDQEGEGKRVLDGVNLEIGVGEVVGIAGPSGGGKTTLLRAMLGLLPDYTGELRIFGTEVRDLDKNTLADGVSYGPQRPYVRQGTVRENIIEGVLRHGELRDGEIMEALRRARLELEPDKMLSERGDNISPGQNQRLSLARIFVKRRARLVILDEATSMLDGTAQSKIMKELRKHAEGRALMMVAHRLDTLKWADRIVVIDGGRIVQSGTFDELSTVPGTFADLLGQGIPPALVAAE